MANTGKIDVHSKSRLQRRLFLTTIWLENEGYSNRKGGLEHKKRKDKNISEKEQWQKSTSCRKRAIVMDVASTPREKDETALQEDSGYG